MEPLENDRWPGSFTGTELGTYGFTVRAWVDRFATWRRDLEKKVDAGQDVRVDLLTGAELVEGAIERGRGDGRLLRRLAGGARGGGAGAGAARGAARGGATGPARPRPPPPAGGAAGGGE